MDATAKTRDSHWRHWCATVKPLGVDPYLQNVPFKRKVRCLTIFAGLVRKGYFNNKRKQVRATTVASALTAVGTTCALAHEVNPTKTKGSDKFLPRIQQMLEGLGKQDPPSDKMLPVEMDVVEYLVMLGMASGATEKEKAIGDLAMIAFFYLLRVGEYTAKGRGARNMAATQTQPFKLRDVAFFYIHSATKRLRKLLGMATDMDVMAAKNATLRLDNQKNGWKNVCVNHEHNGNDIHCGVRAVGRRVCHIRKHTSNQDTPLYTYWDNGQKGQVTDQDIRDAIKLAALALDYPHTRGIPISQINTHSLRIGGACALALAGYSDTQIQKMGRWRGATFKEYVRENLSNYSEGMSKAMSEVHGFVCLDSAAFTDVTSLCEQMQYGCVINAAQQP